jgi:ankyrin repeat protein
MESSSNVFRQVPPGPPPTFANLVHAYTKNGNHDYLARLLQIWPNTTDNDHKSMGGALHHAIFKGDITAVQMMLDAGVSPIVEESQDPNYTPLLTAAETGQREIARLLCQLVGPEGRSDPAGRTCLWVAADNGHADLVNDFLHAWYWTEDEVSAALWSAARQWHDETVGLLLSQVSFEVDTLQAALQVSIDRGPILPVAFWGSRNLISTSEEDLRLQRMVCRLVDAGANPDAKLDAARGGQTPLIHAAANGRHRIGALKGLLERGANVNAQDKDGKTALHKLFKGFYPSTDSLRVLLQHGASPEIADGAGETGMHAAAAKGTPEQLQLCVAACRGTEIAIRL